MTSMSAEEALEQLSEMFGRDDAKLVQAITGRVIQLHDEFDLFRYFFCGPRARVEALNNASGPTARTLQNALRDKIVLTVRALTDPSRDKKGNKNISAQALCVIAKKCSVDLDQSWKKALAQSNICRKHADKYLAHYDQNEFLMANRPSLRLSEISGAVKQIGLFVQDFHRETRAVDYMLLPIKGAGDEQSFLASVHFGNVKRNELHEEWVARYRSGETFDPAEYQWPDWLKKSDDGQA